VNDIDRLLTNKALADFDSLSAQDKENLMSLFGTFGMFMIPMKRNISSLVASIARQQLLDFPAPFVEQIKSGIPHTFLDTFWSQLTVPAIDHLFREQLPTGEKVCRVMEIEEDHHTQDQLDCMYYLQQFVLQLDQEELATFLHFVTGSSVMPEKIWIKFNTLAGEMRRPIAHTCSNTLELSTVYCSPQDLKREFMRVLYDPLCFHMSMA